MATHQAQATPKSTTNKQKRSAKLKRAVEYKKHIINLIKQKRGSSLEAQLAPISTKLNASVRMLSPVV